MVATNHSAQAIQASISLRVRGLGVKRVVNLGTLSLSAGETRTVPWLPATSPIAPTGTSASVLAFVHYDSAGNTLAIPSQPMTMSFDKTGGTAFVSTNDDLGVRLASLGRPYTDASKANGLSTADRAAVLSALGAHRGRRDGFAIDESPEQVTKQLPTAEGESEEGDVVPLPGEILASNAKSTTPVDVGSSESNDAPASSLQGGPIFIGCVLWSHTNTKTGKYCANWQPQGFRDVSVSSGVVPEDFTGQGPAAYANAVAKSGSTVVWQGRLDENGCTPVIEFCNNVESLDVSTASLQRPNTGVFLTSRELKIQPTFTYAASPSLRYSLTYPPYESRIIFNINSGNPTVRVASIVSRILKMPDNGIRNDSLFSPDAPLVIHTEDGCRGYYYNPPYPSTFAYTDPSTGQTKYGEACADEDAAWFGQVLSIQGSEDAGYTYAPTSWHTTQDAVTIGHELGHSAQYSMHGSPGTQGYDKPQHGDCSCEWVTSGNRTHCLQSQHKMASAELEGFGHFYAARVMNDVGPGLDARFTYYKTYRLKLFGTNYSVAPPVPLSIGAPASGQGWVRAWCPEANRSSEYDWLTFLWAINGKAASNARSTMMDIFAIFRNASGNFIWQNIQPQANAYFGSSFDPRAQLFSAQLLANGLIIEPPDAE